VKKKTQQTDAEALSAAADYFSDQAEKLQQRTLLAKANALLRTDSDFRPISHNISTSLYYR